MFCGDRVRDLVSTDREREIGVRVHPGDAVVAQTPVLPQANLGVPYQPDTQVPVAVVPAFDKG